MGMLILAAVAREKGYRVHLIDAKGQGTTPDEVARAHRGAAARLPRPLGDHDLGHQRGAHRRAGQAALPGIVTILGGSHVSAIPERTLTAFPSIDYGIVGEGEISLFELLDAARARRARRRRARRSPSAPTGRCVANPRAPYIDDLDALPPPAWDLLPDFPHRFQPSLFGYPRTPVATLITSRGCPFTCSFCDRSTSGTQRAPARRRNGRAALPRSSPSAACGTSSSSTISSRCASSASSTSARPCSTPDSISPGLQQPSQPARPADVGAHAARRLLADRLRHRVGLAARARHGEARGAHPAHARDAAHDAGRRHPHQGLPDDRAPHRDASRASPRPKRSCASPSSTSARSPSSRPIPARPRIRPSASTARSRRTGSA